LIPGVAGRTQGMNIQDARIGMTVTFGRPNGEQTLGEVVKINGKSLKVRTLEGRGKRDASGQTWRVAASLCTPADGSAVPAPVPMGPDYGKLSEAEILAKVEGIYCQLSPENLTCDGELSRSQVAARYGALRRQLAALFKALGRTVSEDEVYRQMTAHRRSA